MIGLGVQSFTTLVRGTGHGGLPLAPLPDFDFKMRTGYGFHLRFMYSFVSIFVPGSRFYNNLVLSESLFPHLLEIEASANRRIEEILPALMKDAGVTENLKAADPMKWVGLMNTCHAQAEEIVLAELIYN